MVGTLDNAVIAIRIWQPRFEGDTLTCALRHETVGLAYDFNGVKRALKPFKWIRITKFDPKTQVLIVERIPGQ